MKNKKWLDNKWEMCTWGEIFCNIPKKKSFPFSDQQGGDR